MRRTVIGLAVLLALAFLSACGPAEAQTGKAGHTLKVNEIARIGNRVISAEQVIARVQDAESMSQDQEAVLASAVNYLVHTTLLDLEAQRMGFEVSLAGQKEESQKMLDALKARVKESQLPWEDWLRRKNLTEETLIKRMDTSARIKLQQRVLVNFIETSQESIEIAHMLFAKQAAADEVLKKLNEGGNWEDLATNNSLDAETKNTGGKLPRHYRGDGQLPADTKENKAEDVTEAKVWALKDGEWTKPLRGLRGWHIIKRIRTFAGNPAPFAKRAPDLLKFPDVDQQRFERWVRITRFLNSYGVQTRIPGKDCEPDKAFGGLEANQIAKVGPRVITAEQLITCLKYAENLAQDERQMNLTNAINYLLFIALLELEASRLGVVFSERELTLEVESQIAKLKAYVKDRWGGAVTWEEFLREYMKMDEPGLKQYFQARVKTILLKRVVVTYFETSEDHLVTAHILLKTQAKAESVWTQLNRGGKWDDIARKESEDVASRADGGRLPHHYKGDGMFPADCADAKEDDLTQSKVWKLQDGEYTKPLRSTFGWHIVKRTRMILANQARITDRHGELLARPDVDEDRFKRWVRVVFSRNEYATEFRVPGEHCEADQPIK